MNTRPTQTPDSTTEIGLRFLSEARYEVALAYFKQACEQQPSLSEPYKGLAICLQHLGQFQNAESAYRKALSISPNDHEIYSNLGLLLAASNRPAEGCRHLERAAEISSEQVDIYFNLGNVRQDAGDSERAREAYNHALRLNPDHYDTLTNLGTLLKREAHLDEADGCFRRALAVEPKRPEAYTNLATLLLERGVDEEAEKIAREGLAQAPHTADSHYNLGNIHRLGGAYGEALEAYRQALLIAPDHAATHWNKALTHLAMGQFRKGWREYEWRLKKDDWPQYYPYRHDTAMWTGEDIGNKTLLVHDEQGYGDTIQFSRYLIMAKARCKRLIFETRRPLISLFKGAGHIDHLTERPADKNTSQSWDFHIPLLSLPHILKTEVDSIPCTTPYLIPQASKVAYYSRGLDRQKLNVGLVWAGNPGHQNDQHRSLRLSRLLPLFDLPQFCWHSLQKGPASTEIRALPEKVSMRDWNAQIHSFADTAALIWNLDLVICVDTAVAHLGGALGKLLWLVLPSRNVDWRWQIGQRSNAWYPSMTLFRRSCNTDGSDLADELVRHLKRFVHQASLN